LNALRMLQEDLSRPVTEIALNVGYDTPSAFNKVFKKILNVSPRDFRNLGQVKQSEVIYRLSKPNDNRETKMKLNMNLKPEVITRPDVHYLYFEKTGPFSEIAPLAWEEMLPRIGTYFEHKLISEFLGLSKIDQNKKGEEAMIYQAGVGLLSKPETVPNGLQYQKIKSGKYARFLLKGPYPQIWIAFDQIFKVLAESQTRLRDGFCIENYLNDPKVTPEPELLSELLVPIA